MKRLVTGLISLLLSVVVQVANAAPPAARKNLDIFNVSLPDLDNKPRKLSDWRGKILVVNFWASWCGPCRDEMPEFMQLQKQYRDKGVQFVGIAADNPQAAADFARKLGINYPVLQGEETALDMMPLAGNSFWWPALYLHYQSRRQNCRYRTGPYIEKAPGGGLATTTGAKVKAQQPVFSPASPWA